MTQPSKPRPNPRVHAYAASFGHDFASQLIRDTTQKTHVVLDPFVGAGTTALQSVLLDRNTIGIDVDPLACAISRVLTSRFDALYFAAVIENLQRELRNFETSLISEPYIYIGLRPGSAFRVNGKLFGIPDEPAIGYWFDPSHMATLSIACEMATYERDPLVRQALQVSISSSIIRKWPNTLSYAMDIDHSRPHRVRNPRAQPIGTQFALLRRVLGQMKDVVLHIQESLATVEATASIVEGDSLTQLSLMRSDSIDFVLTSPPYLNAIDYPRAHKFSQWWLSPAEAPAGRSKYLGLRRSPADENEADLLGIMPELVDSLSTFRGEPVYGSISRYVFDLAAIIEQLYRVLRSDGKVAFVVADNIIKARVFPVSIIVASLLRRSGFGFVNTDSRVIKRTKRRYPFGVNGFVGPMKNEYLITASKSA